MVDILIEKNVPTLFHFLGTRLLMLKSHLGGYRFAILRDSDSEFFHFDLEGVSRITFVDDGLEIILRDSTTVYLKYSTIREVSLLRLDSTNSV